MKYRIILIDNGIYKKTIAKFTTRKGAFVKFHKLNEQNKILFPKKYVVSYKLKPIKHEICVIKEFEEGDIFRTLRNDKGKLYIENPLGNWVVLSSADWEIEETFNIHTLTKKYIKKTTFFILKRLLMDMDIDNTKEIIVVQNKLIIHNEQQFDVICCKNLKDAQRLHHVLGKIISNENLGGFFFMGTASKISKLDLLPVIDELLERTK